MIFKHTVKPSDKPTAFSDTARMAIDAKLDSNLTMTISGDVYDQIAALASVGMSQPELAYGSCVAIMESIARIAEGGAVVSG